MMENETWMDISSGVAQPSSEDPVIDWDTNKPPLPSRRLLRRTVSLNIPSIPRRSHSEYGGWAALQWELPSLPVVS